MIPPIAQDSTRRRQISHSCIDNFPSIINNMDSAATIWLRGIHLRYYPQLCKTLWIIVFKSPKMPLSTQFCTMCITLANDFSFSVDTVDISVDNPIYGMIFLLKIYILLWIVPNLSTPLWNFAGDFFHFIPLLVHNMHRHEEAIPAVLPPSTCCMDVRSARRCSSVRCP